MNNKLLVQFLFILLVIISIFIFVLPNKKDYWQKAYDNDYLFENFNGTVIKKYRDRNNHNDRTLLIRSSNSTRHVLMEWSLTSCYDIIEVGDSISKKKKSRKIFIYDGKSENICYLEEVYNVENKYW